MHGIDGHQYVDYLPLTLARYAQAAMYLIAKPARNSHTELQSPAIHDHGRRKY
jgi:hypothetical protein